MANDQEKQARELAEAPYIVASAAEQIEAQRQEYGRYVATGPIDIGGTRAFNAGDRVPQTHVRLGIVAEDQVEVVEDAASPATAPLQVKVPAKSASKEEWVAYVTEHRSVTQEYAEGKTRDELAAKFS